MYLQKTWTLGPAKSPGTRSCLTLFLLEIWFRYVCVWGGMRVTEAKDTLLGWSEGVLLVPLTALPASGFGPEFLKNVLRWPPPSLPSSPFQSPLSPARASQWGSSQDPKVNK